MIEIVILYILNKYDATIYRITKIIDELFFAYLKSSTGTVNPAIKRLEKAQFVTCAEKMTDGGLLSKIYSITISGKKHLKESLISFEQKNPYHLINEAKIALYCSDILDENEIIRFKENLNSVLEIFKIKLENGLKNEYIELNEVQKKVVQDALEEVENLIGINNSL